MNRILIIGCSSMKRTNPEPMRALFRYNGHYWQTLRCYLPYTQNIPKIIALSAKYGFIGANAMIPYYDVQWRDPDAIDPSYLGVQYHAKIAPLLHSLSDIFVAAGPQYQDVLEEVGLFADVERLGSKICLPSLGLWKYRGKMRRWLMEDENAPNIGTLERDGVPFVKSTTDVWSLQ